MSDTNTRIYLELPAELQQLLSDNDLSVSEILRQQNIQAEVTHGVVPDQAEEGVRSKEVVTIILASSAFVLAVGLAISRVLHTLQRKPHLVEYYELSPLIDVEGSILLDKKGQPRLRREKRYELLEPRKEDSKQQGEISFTPTNVVIKFGAADKQMETPDTAEAE